jgi:hypothetical protein
LQTEGDGQPERISGFFLQKDIMIEMQDSVMGIPEGTREDKSAIRIDVSAIRKDTSATFYKKYDYFNQSDYKDQGNFVWD